MGRRHFAFTLEGKKKVKLRQFDSGDTDGLAKEEGLARLQKLGEEFAELGNLLTFAGQDALLVVLQGRDASGKDGTIRKILDFSNMQTAHVYPFKAPNEEERARVFRAWTNAEEVTRWMGPGPTTVQHAELDLRVGGAYHIHMRSAEGRDFHVSGLYREVSPPERIVQTFECYGMPGHVIIETATLEDLGDGRTRFVIISLFHTTDERDGFLQSGMEGGMNESYAALDSVLAAMR